MGESDDVINSVRILISITGTVKCRLTSRCYRSPFPPVLPPSPCQPVHSLCSPLSVQFWRRTASVAKESVAKVSAVCTFTHRSVPKLESMLCPPSTPIKPPIRFRSNALVIPSAVVTN